MAQNANTSAARAGGRKGLSFPFGRHAPTSPSTTTPSTTTPEKSPSGVTSLCCCLGHRKSHNGKGSCSDSHDKTSGARAWESHLPRPADESAILEKYKAVFDGIEKFVELYYLDKTALELDAGHKACLTLVQTPHLPSALSELVQSSRPTARICRPTTLIKHCLSYTILQAMTPDGDARLNLLPPSMTALPQALLRSNEHTNTTVFAEAFAHWRVLTAYLQPPVSNEYSPAVRAITERIFTAFAPWESNADPAQRRRAMVAILQSATEAGQLMFAQPTTFSYVWEAQEELGVQQQSEVLVVKPGLLAVADEDVQAGQKVLLAPTSRAMVFGIGDVAA